MNRLKWYEWLLVPILFPIVFVHTKLVDWKVIRYWHYSNDDRIFKCRGMYMTFIKIPIIKIETRFMKIKIKTYYIKKEINK